MPRKSDQEPAPEKQEPALHTFFFPTVGNGVSVLAASQEEANDLIRKHPLYKG